jgi:hypothetical protein
VTQHDDAVHVVPLNDLRDHELSHACWCCPDDAEGDGTLWVHNSLDQREKYETGELRLQ